MIAALLVIVATTPASPQPADDEPVTAVDTPLPESHHDPFVLHDPGEGAIPFERLTSAQQAEVERMAEHAELESGHDVHQGYAAATAQSAQRAQAEIAARALGLEGLDGEGVIP